MHISALRIASAAALSLAIACSGNKVGAGANDPSAQKDQTAGTSDDGNGAIDKPASLSGSYLADHMACVVPKVHKGDQYIQACCVLQDKKNQKIALKGLPNDTFKVAPPVSNAVPAPKIQTVNLTSVDKQLCHVVYRSPLPGGAPAAGLALSGAPVDAVGTIKGFLSSIPLFKRSQPATPTNSAKSLTDSVGKKAAGLRLSGSATALSMTFAGASQLAVGTPFSAVASVVAAAHLIGTDESGAYAPIPPAALVAAVNDSPAVNPADRASGFGGARISSVSSSSAPAGATASTTGSDDESTDENLGQVLSQEQSSDPPIGDVSEFVAPDEPYETTTTLPGATTSQVSDEALFGASDE